MTYVYGKVGLDVFYVQCERAGLEYQLSCLCASFPTRSYYIRGRT